MILLDFLASVVVGNVWPLAFLVVSLLVLRQIRDDVRPIFSAIVGGVSKQAASNATAYGIAILFGLSASLSAFYDIFANLDQATWANLSLHQYAAMWAKVMNPFIVAALAYATQNSALAAKNAPPTVTGATTPPFPIAPPPARP